MILRQHEHCSACTQSRRQPSECFPVCAWCPTPTLVANLAITRDIPAANVSAELRLLFAKPQLRVCRVAPVQQQQCRSCWLDCMHSALKCFLQQPFQVAWHGMARTALVEFDEHALFQTPARASDQRLVYLCMPQLTYAAAPTLSAG
jgi:hypothetical protein